MEVKKITSAQQLEAVRNGVKILLVRMPEGWARWSADRVQQFKDDVQAVNTAGSLAKIEAPAKRILAAYGQRPAP